MNKAYCVDCYVSNKRDLKNSYYSITFSDYDKCNLYKPGSFIQIELPETDLFFRRPMSVASVNNEKNEIEVIMKVVGRGTTYLSRVSKGDRVNILGPLGVSFKLPSKKEKAVIVAGGVGFPPLMYLAMEMINKGYDPKMIEFFYGGRSELDILEKSRLKKMKINLHPITEDGSFGEKGLVTKYVEKFITENKIAPMRMYGCGPEGMLKAVDDLGLKYDVPGQLSLEAPMPCGVGICLGCIVPLRKGGNARVCADGPVFEIGEVIL